MIEMPISEMIKQADSASSWWSYINPMNWKKNITEWGQGVIDNAVQRAGQQASKYIQSDQGKQTLQQAGQALGSSATQSAFKTVGDNLWTKEGIGSILGIGTLATLPSMLMSRFGGGGQQQQAPSYYNRPAPSYNQQYQQQQPKFNPSNYMSYRNR